MSDLFDTTQVDDDPGHWDALAERVAAIAARESTENGLTWLGRSRAGWVAASLLLTAALTLALLPRADSSPMSFRGEWEQALAPADELGRAIVVRDGPPAIGALLLGRRSGV